MENLKEDSVDDIEEGDFEEKTKAMMKIIKEGAKKDSKFILLFADCGEKGAEISALHYKVNTNMISQVFNRALIDFIETIDVKEQDEKPEKIM